MFKKYLKQHCSEPELQQITLSNDEAYELILSINQIIINIDQQQIRNKNIQTSKSIFIFNEENLKNYSLFQIIHFQYSNYRLMKIHMCK